MALEDVLDSRQIAVLEAATECILPSGDGPGAAEANVMGFVRRAASQPFSESRKDRWRRGLDMMQSLARSLHGKDFADCTVAERDGVLEKLGRIPHPITQRFLDGLLSLTLAGFLCDPRHGGNEGEIGWRSVGYEPRTASPEEIESGNGSRIGG